MAIQRFLLKTNPFHMKLWDSSMCPEAYEQEIGFFAGSWCDCGKILGAEEMTCGQRCSQEPGPGGPEEPHLGVWTYLQSAKQKKDRPDLHLSYKDHF